MDEKRLLLQLVIFGVIFFSVLSIMGSFSFSRESERLYKVQKELLEGMDNLAIRNYIEYFEKRRLNITTEHKEMMIEAFEVVECSKDISDDLKKKFEEMMLEKGIPV
ncbi:hypothetical protein SAMN02745945_00964 [Peptoclostridium litorale DSM 5388]|uniref:Uncharacterized protein n=1 Tax=Peptoclostridium litorale DSM 5388 TaxID=1121324 RepID=A0A069R9M7_PEPLI|nr:hypothetical protein [Peptoclostridium litorale]KDR93769.1 hypothetical protein CLIT_23c00410 [Peptoclostridium litorale DSM 5388]SIN85505.1 hypothetical protein SAMN02745945_00964 [Peptoclostridium litorale DSM 5388]